MRDWGQMENSELVEAMDWLRRALSIAEKQSIDQLQAAEKEEWLESVARKRVLLKRLEELNADLYGAKGASALAKAPAMPAS